MIVNNFLLASSPFYDAYIQSDLLGKLIFISLFILSMVSWIIMIYKAILTYRVKKESKAFHSQFISQKNHPLSIECDPKNTLANPYLRIYQVLKKHTLDLLNKNHRFGKKNHEEGVSYLTSPDIEFIDMHLMSTIADETKNLEKNLFILSTVVSLAPFLGLLGTVWGILMTFSHLQGGVGGNQMVLSGISLALATTVLGLIDAIPALIGYNYLKNTVASLSTDMEGFSTEILAAVEMHYRKVEQT